MPRRDGTGPNGNGCEGKRCDNGCENRETRRENCEHRRENCEHRRENCEHRRENCEHRREHCRREAR